MAPIDPIRSVIDQPSGQFIRPDAQFRSFISKNPSAEFPPEKGRYHLYVSYACPWAHRALIVRQMKGLQDIIEFTSVHWFMDINGTGWRFATPGEKLPGVNVTPDSVNGAEYIKDIYRLANPDYTGRFSVPVLWDKKTKTIVSNESSEIIRMFGTEFDALLEEKYQQVNLVPEDLRECIDELNGWIYDDINNGVYKCGIAQIQQAYEKCVTQLFRSLDRVEELLTNSAGPYILGSQLTEVDLFKTNLRSIRSGYPSILRWLLHLYWDLPEFHETTNFEHIKKHYFTSLTPLNPTGVVPVGPIPDILEKKLVNIQN